MKQSTLCVIGAGIAGLSAAYRLQQRGFAVTVLEAADHVGGRIKSVRQGDFLFDVGAFIYLGSYTDAVSLMREVGLESQLAKVRAYGAMPRGGELKFLDFDKPVRAILGTDYLSAGSKLRALKLFNLLRKHWHDLNYDDASGIAAIDTDTVASYCRRELNEELYDYLASVVVRGPWLSDGEWVSVGQLLWTMRNFFKPYFYGLKSGMDALPRALAAQLDVKLGHRAINVTEQADHVQVTYTAAGVERTDRFDGCVITTPAGRALELFPQMIAAQKALYAATEYIVSVNTHVGLARRPANPATYIMVSAREHPDLAGVIVDHLKAPGRAPAHKGSLTIFCRHEWCVQNLEVPDEQVLAQVLRFIEPYYGDLRADVEEYAIGRWPQVVPKMPRGRFKAIAAYEKAIDGRARVQLAGDVVCVGGVNAALVSGRRAADVLAARFA